MDVQIHGGLAGDGLAGRRSSATAAAPGARMLVHSIAYDRGDRVDGSGGIGLDLSICKSSWKIFPIIIPVW